MLSPDRSLNDSLLSSPKNKNSINKDETNDDKKISQWKNELYSMLSLAWPVTLSTIARVSQGNIDTAFLGHLGVNQLAAVALTNTLSGFVGTFIYAPAYGLNSLCSQTIGAGNPKLCGNWLQLSLLISFIFGLVCIFGIFLNVKNILYYIGDEKNESVLHYSQLFGVYIILSLFPNVIYVALRSYFQSINVVIPVMVISWCVGVALNICLNKIFIYGIKPYWNGMGFIGSPLATSVSVTIQLIIFIIYSISYRKYPQKHNIWNGWTFKSFSKNRMIEFFKVIAPMTIGDASANWAGQIVIMSTASLPSKDVASISICYNLNGMLWAIYWGVGLATIIRTGKNIGNGNIKQTKLVIKISIILCFIICGVIAFISFIFTTQIAKLFTNDNQVIHLLKQSIPLVCLLFFIAGIGWPCAAAMEGISRNVAKAYVYSTTAWLLYLPLSIYFTKYNKIFINKFNYSPVCIIFSIAICVESIRVILIYIVIYKTNWKNEVYKAKKRSEALAKLNKNKNDKIINN
eukprot:331432_1